MIIRFWGGHRESDWNSYWRMNELMAQKDQLAAALEHFGIEEIDICPPRHARAPVTLHYFEIFLPKLHSPGDIQLVCHEIRNLTGRLTRRWQLIRTKPSTRKSTNAFCTSGRFFR